MKKLFCLIFVALYAGCSKSSVGDSRGGAQHSKGVGIEFRWDLPSSTLVSPDENWKVGATHSDENVFYIVLTNQISGRVYSSRILSGRGYKRTENWVIYFSKKDELCFELDDMILERWILSEEIPKVRCY